jgi:poly-beta-1,6-N-acetyl-D-glucosamine synthase
MVVALVAFCLSGVFLSYVLIGYPLLLRLMAKRRPRPVYKEFIPRTVTVLLPVHNGENWIRQKLSSILALDYPGELVQILVISDGSTDGTEAIASEFASKGVELLRLPKGGKPAALNAGLKRAMGDVVFFTDVRQKLEPDCLRKLVSCFADPQVGAACGELVILDGFTHEEASIGLYWKIEKWIRRQLSDMGTLLVVTGCVYAIRRDLADPLPPDALGDDIFMPQTILKKGYRVVFESGAKAYDYPTDSSVEFNRKVRTLAGLYQYIRQCGLGPYPFHFFSYKVSRLLLPYALLAVAASTLFLADPLRAVVLIAQFAFYSAALVDPVVRERSPLKRFSSPARAFVVMMIASFYAASVLLRPASELWKTTHVRPAKTGT